MGKIVAGIGTSHVPSIGAAYDKGEQKSNAWSPLFSAYEPVQDWLEELKPDVAIITYNDHGCDFFFDKYPTFAIGAADEYLIGDEGFGMRPLPPVPGNSEFSWHLIRELVYINCSTGVVALSKLFVSYKGIVVYFHVFIKRLYQSITAITKLINPSSKIIQLSRCAAK